MMPNSMILIDQFLFIEASGHSYFYLRIFLILPLIIELSPFFVLL